MKKENIPKYIFERLNLLENSSFSYKSLFEVSFDQGDRIFGEYLAEFVVKTISYKEMKQYCFKMASYLKPQLVSKTNCFVGLYMENCPNWIATFWALLMLGYKPALLNCKLPNELNNKIINTLGITEIITNKQFEKVQLNAKLIVLSDQMIDKTISQCIEYVPSTWADEIAINTTATTLNYKICIYTGKDITNLALNAKKILRISKQIKKHYKHRLKQLMFLPLYHIFGLTAVLFWFSLFGRTMVFLKDYAPTTLLNTIRKTEVTHIFSIPLFWNTIAKEVYKEINDLEPKQKKRALKAINKSIKLQKVFPILGAKIARLLFKKVINATLGPSVLFCISGGSYLPNSTLELFNAMGYWLTTGYGATETGIDCVELRRNVKYRLSGCVGKPFESIQMQIVDGSLQLKGESTCSYIIDSLGNRISMHDQWYDMKDQCHFDDKGYMWVSGRSDDVFVAANGEKINPDVIEQNLHFLYVKNYCLISYQGKLSLLIQINKDSPSYAIKKIIDEVQQQTKSLTANNSLVNQILFTYDPIANQNAIKVSRTILNKLIAENKVTVHPISELQVSTSVEPQHIKDEITAKVLSIFASVLNKDKATIGLDNNFIFDLGGTSLDYFDLIYQLQDQMQVKIETDQGLMTVNAFADYINRKVGK